LSELEQQGADSSDGGGRPGLPLDPVRLWLVFRTRWHVLVLAGVVGAFAGAAVAKKVVKQNFAARAVLAWEGPATVTPLQRQTILDSITITSNLEQVAKRLKLTGDPALLRNFVLVGASGTSNMVGIDGVWGEAQGAADLVNGVVDVFLEARRKQLEDAGKTEIDRARTAVESAERRHAAAVAAYEAFRSESGISDVSQERQAAIMRAAELSVTADTARAQAGAARSELERLRGTGVSPSAPDAPAAETASLTAADKQRVQQDEQRLAQARRELEAAKVQYSEDHPNVLRLRAEVESIEKRLGAVVKDSAASGQRRLDALQRQEAQAAIRQKAAEEFAEQVRDRLSKLSAVEGRAVALLGEQRVSQQALEAARGMLAAIELEKEKPPAEFRMVERAKAPQFATQSGRKKVALVFPIGSVVLAAIFLILWSLRRADVRTPVEAAFWSGLPVVGASTWPRDPDMLGALMHDLDDYAPRCVGVTLIVGASIEEAHLARRVAEWDGHQTGQPFGAVDEQRLIGSGADVDGAYRLAVRDGARPGQSQAPREVPNMQILTLTGPVPAQALRRAARLADRVLVVVTSGKHSVLQLLKIKGRLGRDDGIGVLLVGLEKDLAMVRDRVGPVERFWYATRGAAAPART